MSMSAKTAYLNTSYFLRDEDNKDEFIVMFWGPCSFATADNARASVIQWEGTVIRSRGSRFSHCPRLGLGDGGFHVEEENPFYITATDVKRDIEDQQPLHTPQMPLTSNSPNLSQTLLVSHSSDLLCIIFTTIAPNTKFIKQALCTIFTTQVTDTSAVSKQTNSMRLDIDPVLLLHRIP